MKLFKYLGLFILMLIALVINIVEGIIMVISYPLRLIDYILHIVFKKISEWTLAAVKRFNFINIFRKYEE